MQCNGTQKKPSERRIFLYYNSAQTKSLRAA